MALISTSRRRSPRATGKPLMPPAVLNLYDLVRIVRLHKPPEAYDGWGVNQRPPQVGDTGCLLEILRAPGHPDCYAVEESGWPATPFGSATSRAMRSSRSASGLWW